MSLSSFCVMFTTLKQKKSVADCAGVALSSLKSNDNHNNGASSSNEKSNLVKKEIDEKNQLWKNIFAKNNITISKTYIPEKKQKNPQIVQFKKKFSIVL